MDTRRNDSTILYIIRFIAFVLMFIFLGSSIGAFWRYLGKSIGSALEIDASLKKGCTVIIDAGHGGEDGGATALSPVPEKDLNLDIAKTLYEMLGMCGVDVIMTRNDDVSLSCNEGSTRKGRDLAARRIIAENTENAVFVSIHMNSFAIEKYSGLQVYYSPNNAQSKALADTVQSYVKSTLQSDNQRKTKSGGDIYLLEKLSCPTILVECGFLSNAEESALLNDANYRRRLALVLCAAIYDFARISSENAH